jgi:predicted nucleic acid-binding protein
MPIYVDTSALLKRYLEEPDSDAAEALLASDFAWFSGRHRRRANWASSCWECRVQRGALRQAPVKA